VGNVDEVTFSCSTRYFFYTPAHTHTHTHTHTHYTNNDHLHIYTRPAHTHNIWKSPISSSSKTGHFQSPLDRHDFRSDIRTVRFGTLSEYAWILFYTQTTIIIGRKLLYCAKELFFFFHFSRFERRSLMPASRPWQRYRHHYCVTGTNMQMNEPICT